MAERLSQKFATVARLECNVRRIPFDFLSCYTLQRNFFDFLSLVKLSFTRAFDK